MVGIAHADGPLVVCGHPGYPPFMWADADEIKGVGAEVLKIIFKESDIEVVPRAVGNWRRCLKEVEKGNIDGLVAAYITHERRQFAEFTETPLSDDPLAVFVWKGREFKFDDWNDLDDKKIGAILGGSMGQEFDDYLKTHKQVEYVSSREQNFIKLERGRIDAHLTGLYAGQMQAKKYGYEGKIVPLSTAINTEYLHVALSKKSRYLEYLPLIDAGIKRLQADGTIKRLIEKYSDAYIEAEKNNQ